MAAVTIESKSYESQVGLSDPGALFQPKWLRDWALPSLLFAVAPPHPAHLCTSLPLALWRCTGKVQTPCAGCSRRLFHSLPAPSTLSADTQSFVAQFFVCLHFHHFPPMEALHSRMLWHYITWVNREVFLWKCIVEWVVLHCMGHIIWHSLEETIVFSMLPIAFSSSIYGTFLRGHKGVFLGKIIVF